MGRGLTLAAVAMLALALAACNRGAQQAAGDHAVAVNSGDAADTANAAAAPR